MKDIDKLFSEALHDHSTPAPVGLWERLESGLPASTGHKSWFRWAAIMVPALVAAGIWMTRPDETGELVAKSPAPSPTPAENMVTTPSAQPIAVITAQKKAASHKPVKSTVLPEIHEPVETAVVEEIFLTEEITIEPVVQDPEPKISEPVSTKPIVIVYSLETVTVPQAVEKETSLDRVVEFALAVKHSDPIADIRGLKDELFAFDFRKKQTKKN